MKCKMWFVKTKWGGFVSTPTVAQEPQEQRFTTTPESCHKQRSTDQYYPMQQQSCHVIERSQMTFVRPMQRNANVGLPPNHSSMIEL